MAILDDHEHKVAAVKVVAGWGVAGGAKAVEVVHDHATLFLHLSIADWTGLAALVYTLMQITVFAPRWWKAVKDIFHGIFS